MEKPPLPLENLTASQMESWARKVLESGSAISAKETSQVVLWIAKHVAAIEQHVERKLR